MSLLLNSAAFFRDLKHEPILINHAKGLYLYDENGKAYLDAASGAAVASLGHGNQEIAEVLFEQAQKLSFAHPSKFATKIMVEFAEKLVTRAPEGLTRAYFTSGGSEANETAMKLARQYHLAKGNTSKYKVITRRTSYHGATLGALSLSGQVSRRQLFTPMMQGAPMIAPTSCYRCPFGQKYHSCHFECANDLEITLLNEGPENIAAFIAEPIVGSSAPGRSPRNGYWQRIREICDKYEVLFIADEVMSGNGRSGTWWMMQQTEIIPDIITTAKGLSAGYTPLGAVLIKEAIYKEMQHVKGYFRHGHTYAGNPLSCAIGSKVIDIIEREGLLANVQEMGVYLKQKLHDALAEHPYVGIIRGKGLLLGVEFVSDKVSKQPFEAELNICTRFSHACLDKGLYIYQGGGNVDGVRGDHALIAPPFTLNKSHADFIADTMREALDGVAKNLSLKAA